MSDSKIEIVTLITVPSELKAATIISLLKAEGINAQTSGGLSAGFKLEAPGGVDILVNETDKEKSLQIISKEKLEFTDEDWKDFDVGDPVE